LESRLIGLEKPTNEEIKVIEEFEERKKKGKLKLIPLNELLLKLKHPNSYIV
jgi:hypothetical protein